MESQGLFDLTGKVAIVTGGNGGLGLGMALGLAGAGANIVVAARNEAKTNTALAEIKALGVKALGIAVDVSQEADVARMVSHTVEALGRVDILVNNAGISIRSQPQELSADDWDRVVDVNLKSVFLASKEVHRHMKKQGGGKIINIGSMFSLFGSDWVSPYSASKGGVVQLTKSLAVAWASDNIQVNAILPGWFMTGLTESIPERDPARYELINQRIPTERWGKPEELQGPVVFLASSGSDYVTGAVLTVDGGYSVK
ncbi:MAG: 2-deoxy-D-gluconate 3-dehydrogenase [SAR202 cluster bacterium Io17-Chloro-G7]|nr:MAG: 2-deoxy-D-gluconate 3-dehydrogenase [SAR202 cluster bacterium Io17-Chloro-G7]